MKSLLDKCLDKVAANVEEVDTFLREASSPASLALLDQKIAELKTICSKPVEHQYGFAERRRIEIVKNYFIAVRAKLESKVEMSNFEKRKAQMAQYYLSVPDRLKTQESPVDAWNSNFNISAKVPMRLAKDYCDHCAKPYLLMKKEAHLVCKFCGRMTKHLQPISHQSTWSSQHQIRQAVLGADNQLLRISKIETSHKNEKKEAKMKMSDDDGTHNEKENEIQSKVVTTKKTTVNQDKSIKTIQQKLEQFRVGTPKIPASLLNDVWHHVSMSKTAQDTSVAELTKQISDILNELGTEAKRYKYSAYKLACLLLGQQVFELTGEEIEDIVQRLLSLKTIHETIYNGKPGQHTFQAQYMAHQVCLLRGHREIAECFPLPKSFRTAHQQQVFWTEILHYLRIHDNVVSWAQVV
jgi:hypothetical protein